MSTYWTRPRLITHDGHVLTENLDETILGPETSYRNKFLITTSLCLPKDPGPYIFFQMLNDKSPEGDFLMNSIAIFYSKLLH
jgi:hypothetical protein